MLFWGERSSTTICNQTIGQDLNIKTQIIGCPTIRENNGLAKSSRNQLISKEDLEKAP